MYDLVVKVLEARGLAAADTNGFSDPYAVICIGKQKKKTKFIRKTLNPSWKEEFELSLFPDDKEIEVMVYDRDFGTADGLYNRIRGLIPDGKERWYHLEPRSDPDPDDVTVTGDILLAFEKRNVHEDELIKEQSDDPLSLVKLIPNLKTSILGIIYCVEPILELRQYIFHILIWREKASSALFMLVFLWVAWNQYFLSALGFTILAYFGSKYVHAILGGGTESFIPPSKINSNDLQKQIKLMKDRTRVGRKTSVMEDIRTAEKIISKILEILTLIRQFENYREDDAKKIVGGLLAFTMLSFWLPVFSITLVLARYAILIGGLYAFTLYPLFHHFPRLRRNLTPERIAKQIYEKQLQLAPKFAQIFDKITGRAKKLQAIHIERVKETLDKVAEIRKEQEEFQKLFQLPTSERFSHVAECEYELNEDDSIKGSLYISQSYLCFHSTSEEPGSDVHNFKLSYMTILDVTREISTLRVVITKSKRFSFDEVDTEFFLALERLWKTFRQSNSKAVLSPHQNIFVTSPGNNNADETTVTSSLSNEQWEHLYAVGNVLKFHHGEIIVGEDEYPRSLYIMRSGTVRLFIKGHACASLNRDNIFGMASFVLNKPLTVAVVCFADNTEVLKIDADDVLPQLAHDTELSYAFHKMLVSGLVGLNRIVTEFIKSNPELYGSTEKTSKKLDSLKNKFNLPPSENLLCEYRATWKHKPTDMPGQLYVFQHGLAFRTKVFGAKMRVWVPYAAVSEIASVGADFKRESHVVFRIKTSEVYLFEIQVTESETEDSIMDSINKSYNQWKEMTVGRSINLGELVAQDQQPTYLQLTNQDWDLIIAGSIQATYRKEDFILEMGRRNDNLFQILTGCARVQIQDNVILTHLTPGTVFGENSFAAGTGGTVTTDVIAENEVTVCKIEMPFLLALFQVVPSLQGPFYQFLAAMIATRIYKMSQNIKKHHQSHVLMKYDNNDSKKAKRNSMKVNQFLQSADEDKKSKKEKKEKKHSRNRSTDSSISSVSSSWEKGSVSSEKSATSAYSEDSKKHEKKLAKIRLQSVDRMVSTMNMLASRKMNSDDWNVILKDAKSEELAKDQYVIREGAKNENLYMIWKGSVIVEKMSIDNTLAQIAILQTKEIFGEMSFLDKSNICGASIVAAEQTEVRVISAAYINSLLVPCLSTRFYKYLCLLLCERLVYANAKKVGRLKELERKTDSEKIQKIFKLDSKESIVLGTREIYQANNLEIRCSLSRKRKLDVHGKLYVTNHFVCFAGGVLGSKSYAKIHMSSIIDLEKKRPSDKKVSFTIRTSTEEVTFLVKNSEEEYFDQLKMAISGVSPLFANLDSNNNSSSSFSEISDVDDYEITQADWDILLKHAKSLTFKRDDIILPEGKLSEGLYEVGSGSVRIEKLFNGKPSVLSRLGPGEIFGEVAFLEGIPSSAAVVADEDEVVVYHVPNIKADLDESELSTRFLAFVATTLARRLRKTF